MTTNSREYSKKYYEKNKAAHRVAQKKYQDKLKALKPPRVFLSEEEKKAKYQERLARQNERYKNDTEFRENAQAAYRNRYNSDPEFRKKKRAYEKEYLKKYKKKKREEQHD